MKDETQQRREQQAAASKREADRHVEDIRWLMESERGRRIAARLLERSGLFRSSFAGTAEQTSFNEGQRNQGLQLQGDILAAECFDRYVQMLREYQHARSESRHAG